MSNGYKKKSISWYALWKRIGKQPMYKTQNTKVQVLIDGELKECALVIELWFYGRNIYLLCNHLSAYGIRNTTIR